MSKNSKMSKAAAARIQSSTAKSNGGVTKGSFAARAQSAASKGPKPANWPSKVPGKKSGDNRDYNPPKK